jgi:hypothetical protein
MRTTLFMSAIVLLAAQMAAAQSLNSPSANTGNSTANSPPSASNNSGDLSGSANNSARANIQDMLQKSGYTDIRIQPGSFIVHARDKDGNRVAMSIGPDFFTKVTETTDSTGTQSGTGSQSGNVSPGSSSSGSSSSNSR